MDIRAQTFVACTSRSWSSMRRLFYIEEKEVYQTLAEAFVMHSSFRRAFISQITRAHWYREEGDVVARDFVLHISQFDDKASGVYFCGYSTPDGHTRRVSRVNMTSSGKFSSQFRLATAGYFNA